MAKKKEKGLSPEMLLEQALVPEGEQPYPVPDNWVWTRIGSIARFVGGGTPSKSNPDFWGGDIHWASIKDMKGEYLFDTVDRITTKGLSNSASNCCDEGEVILATRIEPGKTIISRIRTAINQDLKIVKSSIDSKFLHYYFQNNRHKIVSKSSGSTVLGITLENVSDVEFPLPPLPEQQRIVDRIESLFEKLDQAKGLIQDALDSFENRKAAILHKAFSGELTRKWREENGNGIGIESWEEKYLEQLCSEVVDCPHSTPKWTEDGNLCLRTTNLKDGYIDFSEVRFVSKESYDERTRRLVPMSGDILFTREGSVGDLGVVPPEMKICMGQRMMLLRPHKDIQPNYIACYLQSPKVREVMKLNTGGSTSLHINVKDVKKIMVPVATEGERSEIVRIIDELLSQEQQSKELLNIIVDIDLMKKAIIARAFRGELGTNDPEEESASKLLKEVLGSRVN